jgi:hypothetical protein
MRARFPLLLLAACQGELGVRGGDSDSDTEDLSRYEGASLRIVEPASATFLAWEEAHDYRAELRAADGTLLDEDLAVRWTSSADAAWAPPASFGFADATLDVGLHDLTAEVELPNGDRLAHTVGGVLVQSEAAGTYVGTLITGFTFQNFPIACAGSTVITIEPYGKEVSGDATCLASAGGFEIPLEFALSGDHEDGRVEGIIGANIVFFELEFQTSGTRSGESLDLEFEGDLAGSPVTGRVEAERISRDAGL